ncbi:MAG: chemotaxis protein CheW [Pseudomonadota bacterium]|nr:chemotaxis protein CheW [Pseudomonadota bacterium]
MSALYLMARIADRPVAIPTAQVESVIDLGDIMPAPLAPPQVRGLVAIRSRVVTVIDTDVALGLPRSTHHRHRAVITSVEGHHYAILVESLDEVETLDAQPLSPGLVLGDCWRDCATGIVEHGGEPMLVLDLAAWIPAAVPTGLTA